MSNSLLKGTILHGQSYNYFIERTLGQGSFGITYLASIQIKGALGTLDGHVKVAIKEFFMKEINGREDGTVTCSSQSGIYGKYRQKFANEAKILSTLNHPNIIKVLELFQDNNTIYYAMEYVDGGSLDAKIEAKGHFSEKTALKYAQKIGNALTYMHEHKMLHLDLKPSNVMLRQNGEVVLIDFGLAKHYDRNGEPESSTTVGGGTPGYAPLEQSSFHEGKGFPVTMDVYALGATLYKMLTGERPPVASDILNKGFPKVFMEKQGISAHTVEVVQQAMSALKKERYSSVSELVSNLIYCPNDSSTVDDIHWLSDVNCFYVKEDYFIAILGGFLYCFPFEERFLIPTKDGVWVDTSAWDGLKNRGTQITKQTFLCCKEDIYVSKSCIITYRSDIQFLDTIKFVNRLFDGIPAFVRVVKEIHLSAFASVVPMIRKDEAFCISTEQDRCLCDTGGGVAEILEGQLIEKDTSYREINLLDEGRKECVGGAFLMFFILNQNPKVDNVVFLDTFPVSISCGMPGKKQEILIESDTTIPCNKSTEVVKGDASCLALVIADYSFDLILLPALHIENVVNIDVDIDHGAHILIKISSLDGCHEQNFTLLDLLNDE